MVYERSITVKSYPNISYLFIISVLFGFLCITRVVAAEITPTDNDITVSSNATDNEPNDDEWENATIGAICIDKENSLVTWSKFDSEYHEDIEDIDENLPDGYMYICATFLRETPNSQGVILGTLYSGTVAQIIPKDKEYENMPEYDSFTKVRVAYFYHDDVYDWKETGEWEDPIEGYVETENLQDFYPIHEEPDKQGTTAIIKYSSLPEYLMPVGHFYNKLDDDFFTQYDMLKFSNSGHYFDKYVTAADCTSLQLMEMFTQSFNLQDSTFDIGYSPDSENIVTYFTISPWEENKAPEKLDLSFSFVDGTFYFDSNDEITNDIVMHIQELPNTTYTVKRDGKTEEIKADENGFINIKLTSFDDIKIKGHTGSPKTVDNVKFGERKGRAYQAHIRKSLSIAVLIIIIILTAVGIIAAIILKELRKPRFVNDIK